MIELRPDKNLLDKNFNGYKLSLDSIPVYRHELHNGIDQVFPNEDQYSFLHMKVFSLHNHLFADPWSENNVYFLDNSFKIYKTNINNETGRLESVTTVWELPQEKCKESGHYDACISFPSRDLVVVSDGSGMMYVAKRSQDKWKCDYSGKVSNQVPFLLTYSCMQDEKTLHCILLHIETTKQIAEDEKPDLNKPKASLANTILYWITLYQDEEGSWTVLSERKMVGNGAVDYVAIEPGCEHLYIASNTSFKFIYDSVNPIDEPEKKHSNSEQMDANTAKLYSWKQTEDDLHVIFPLGNEVTRNDFVIEVDDLNISVTCKGEKLLEGKLFHAVDKGLTTWTVNGQRLELTLIKCETGLMWQYFVEGNLDGEEIIDPGIVGEVHSRLSHLCSDKEVEDTGEGCAPAFNLEQLEECDNLPGEMTILSRLNVNSHNTTHQITLGGHQWIMSTTMNPDTVPAFCIRHDVDACVWQLESPLDDSSWPCNHIGSFLAFGYVSASKQQRKFTLCSPDLSYAIICEAANHIFVYRKSSIVTGDLRNRITGRKVPSVAKQQLIKLDSSSPIVGAYAGNHFLFVLTLDSLYTFHMD